MTGLGGLSESAAHEQRVVGAKRVENDLRGVSGDNSGAGFG